MEATSKAIEIVEDPIVEDPIVEETIVEDTDDDVFLEKKTLGFLAVVSSHSPLAYTCTLQVWGTYLLANAVIILLRRIHTSSSTRVVYA